MNTHLRNLLEFTPGCVWSASKTLKYVILSPRAEIMFGLPAGQLQESDIWSWVSIDDQRSTNMRLLQAAIKQHKSDLELTYCTNTGEQETWFSENIHLHYCPDKNSGEPYLENVSGISFDITKRKQEEENILKMQQQARKMEAIGTLVGGIAHEFNNMLTGIAGNVFLLETEFEKGSKAAERLGRIDNLTRRASGLVGQMLAFGRKQRTTIRDVDLKSLLDKVYAIESAGLPSNVHLSQDIPENILVRADQTQLIQVLTSLISNASDAFGDTTAGEIHIDLEDARKDNTLAFRFPHFNHADMLCLRVTDNGSGIPEDIQDRIFDPFFTTKEVGNGTGMGLSMAYGLMESFGGGIEVESEKDTGTCVRLYLLRAESESAEQAMTKDPTDLQYGHHETILVIDDEPLVSDAAMEMLERIGYRSVAVANGRAAVDFVRDHPNAAVLALLDLIMPDMDGQETAARLRSLNPQLPIVFVTGYNLGDKQLNDIQISRSHVIAKPYEVHHLSHVIAGLLHPESSSDETTAE